MINYFLLGVFVGAFLTVLCIYAYFMYMEYRQCRRMFTNEECMRMLEDEENE